MGFNHISSIGQRDIISSLEDNLKTFLDWSFLEIGGYINISIPSNANQPGQHRLYPVSGDPSVVFPKTWATNKKDWVFETGINHNNSSPTNISGIYLNNTFLPAPTGSGVYGYRLDYPNGRITFNNNISTASLLTMNYSYRFIQVYKANDHLFWKEIANNNYNLSTITANSNYTYNSIQLPAIFIETTARSTLTPNELGTTKNILEQDLLLHIFTDNLIYRNSLIDILMKQKDNAFILYDITKLAKNNKQFLNFRGEPNPNRLHYSDLANIPSLQLNTCYIKNTSNTEIQSLSSNLHHGIVRITLEIFP